MRANILFISFSFLVVVSFSCNPVDDKKPSAKVLFEIVPSSQTGITFENRLTPDADFNILEYDYYYNGGGVAAADFNNDGLTDLFFTGNQVSSKLYLNRGKFKFEEVTVTAGVGTENWATGVSVTDINNDGLADMYISYAGYKEPEKRRHQLFINIGAGSDGIPVFKDEAVEYGLADTSYSTQSAFFDYDRDGDQDVLLINHYRSKINPNLPTEKRTKSVPESNAKLYRNDNGHFTDVSAKAGFIEDGYGLGVSISDINQDGWPDVYISKDFVFDDAMYINNKNGTFTESLKNYVAHTSRFSMGCDIADFNNDSYPDIFTADMMPEDNQRQKLMNIAMNNERFYLTLSLGYLPQYSRNMLQLNNGPDAKGQYSFSEIGQLAGVFKTDWSWSPLFADFDNDGWKDIFISNGIPRDITNNDFISYRADAIQHTSDYTALIKELLTTIEELKPVEKSNYIFRNNGGLQFENKSMEWGINKKGFSNGAVYADLDNDGDLDIVANNINDKAFVYKNKSNLNDVNNFIRIKLEGPFSSGAKIIVNCKGNKQTIEHYCTRGFQSSQDPVEHFGLGTNSSIDTLEVVWLDDKKQRLINVKANQLLILKYQDALAADFFLQRNSLNDMPLFSNITSSAGIDFLHKEKYFEDVDLEPLLPHKFSQNGPCLSVADVDRNGLEDFWIGGPAKLTGTLFLQQKSGRFLSSAMPDSNYEDIGGVFFDANGDTYPDLYVVSGGNEYDPASGNYQDRLYINDGKGNFRRDSSALPVEHFSGSCVKECDFDKDGDIDLFVGGGVIAGNYPFSNPCLLLQNNGKGKFTNVTKYICPVLQNLGLVTAAAWSDFDNDGWQDLIVTGEWMPVMFFKNNHGVFQKIKDVAGLKNINGWYFSIAGGDFDKDGDTDFIVGNLGLNNKFSVSDTKPLRIYAKDFDGNGTVEPILTYYTNSKEYTVAGRDDIASVMPSIKKRFDNYSKFADAGFGQVFSKEQMEGAIIFHANQFASAYIENKGGGQFSFHPLPIEAQFSTIQSIQIKDFDGDGNLDALIAGNYYSPDFMTGRYDASTGLFLKGNGKGRFIPLPSKQSGISIKGDARATAIIKIKNKTCLISAVNSGKLQVYQLKSY